MIRRMVLLISILLFIFYVGVVDSQSVPVGEPFPFYTGVLSDTNSCSQNFKSACTEGCQGDILTFSACGGEDNNQDTFFKLFLEDDQVDINDDYCSASSQIKYTVNASGCNDYCLHMGCFGLASCEANVTATILKVASPLPSVQPTHHPTVSPSVEPTSQPTSTPVGGRPTSCPTGLPTSTPTGQSITIEVNYLLDSVEANSSNCYPTPTSFCNLRSAWLACGVVPSHSLCVISLPVGAQLLMENIVKGGLILEENYNVQILGQGSIIWGQEGVVPAIPTAPIGFPFPLYTGDLSDTATCTQNMVIACTEGCFGNTLTFTSCGGDTSQDTYFKLFQGNETLVASNDDACDSASSIEYTVESVGCAQYCLHIGCFGSLTCSANVSATIEATVFITPRFMFYERNVSVESSIIPKLTVSNLTLMDFGDDDFYGGSMYFEGTVDLTLSQVTFVNSTGELGGSVYVSLNDRAVLVDYCTFTNSTALYGGGMYVDQYVSSFILTNSLFTDCVGTTSAGAIYIAEDNFGVEIVNSTFRYCRALGVISSTGGAITLDAYNDNFLLLDSVFDHCSSTFYGGAVSSLHSNLDSLIIGSTFTNCTSGYGGALFINIGADGLEVSDSEFTDCSCSTDGGAIYLYVGNPDVTLRNIIVNNAYCGNDGGGIFSFQNNENLLVEQSTFNSCRAAGYGGGVAVMFSHTNPYVIDSMFTGCSSFSGGGGVVLLQDNSNLVASGNTYSYCSSDKEGGGLSIGTANPSSVVSSSVFDHCSSSDGGGLYLGTENDNTFVLLSDFTFGYSAGGGGAIVVDTANFNVSFSGVNVANSSSLVAGGGLYVNSGNGQLSIAFSSFINCSSASGGSMFVFSDNYQFSLLSSNITGCSATEGYGGGVYLEQNNADTRVISCVIEGNYASVSGGGVAFLSNNTGVTLGGSSFVDNTAGSFGGAVYVGTSHAQFVTIDLEGLKNAAVVESEHPYQSGYPIGGVPYTIVSQTISVTSAPITGFIVNFDSKTSINTISDTLYIYNNANQDVLLFSSQSGGWPGVNVPSLMIANYSSIFILFSGGTSFNIYPTTSSDNFYGFKCYVYPIFSEPMAPAILAGSTTGVSGGAMYFYSNNQFAVLVNALISGSRAQNGAGVLVRETNHGATFTQVTFLNNHADIDGAGVVIYTTHYGLVFSTCSFFSNIAGNEGGAVNMVTGNGVGIMLYGNEIVYDGCTFTNNSADTGGALYFNDDNVVIMNECYLALNAAVDGMGGALAPDQNNELLVIGTTFDNNWATQSGGAVASILANSISFQNTQVLNNSAGTVGGGLAILSSSAVEFVESCSFSGNSAEFAGGAVALLNSPLWTTGLNGSLVLEANSASTGSAMFFKGVEIVAGSSLNNMLITGNEASIGGTAYWLYDDTMKVEPAGLTGSSMVWSNNVAPYGSVVGTQAVAIFGPQRYQVEVYGEPLSPAIVFTLADFYGEEMPLEGTTSVQVSMSQENVNCFGQSPSISGENSNGGGVVMTGGKATFSALEVLCAPLGNMTLVFEALLGDELGLGSSFASEYYIHNTTVASFRSCVAGEKYTPKQCEVCPYGSFSLNANSQSCIDCLATPGITECYGDQIILERGYWRRFTTSQEIIKCPHYRGCIGGNLTGDYCCEIGYEGPLCSVCSAGYFPVESACVPCKDERFFTPTLIGYIGIFCVLLVAAGASFYIYYKMYLLERKEDDEGVSINETESSSVENSGPGTVLSMIRALYNWALENRKQITSKLKVLVSTYQIVTAASVVLSVNLPHSYTSFIDVASFLNLNLTSALPISCSDSFNFVDSMLMTTMAPLGFACILVLLFCAEYFYKRRIIQQNPNRVRGEKKRTFSRLRYKYMSFFFYLSYLVLPSVTTKIFQIFPCENIDPSHDDDASSDLFLKADMSISCTTDYYYSAVSYASIMIVIYPIGIPLLYFYLLYSQREALRNRDGVAMGTENSSHMGRISALSAMAKAEMGMSMASRSDCHNRDTEGSDADAGMDGPSSSPSMASSISSSEFVRGLLDPDDDEATRRINFLWEAYQPQYWYWEVIETTRRLMLTAVLSVCSPGTSSQGVLAVLLAMFYMKIYGHFRPYVLMNDNTLQEIGQYQIFFTFFGSLIVQNELISHSLNDLLGATLIFINLALIFFSLFFVFYITFSDQGSLGSQKERRDTSRRLSALELEMHSFFSTPTEDQHSESRASEAVDLIKEQETLKAELVASQDESRRLREELERKKTESIKKEVVDLPIVSESVESSTPCDAEETQEEE